MMGGVVLLFCAGLLVYSVVKIRVILGQQGLKKRVNVTMFIVNSGVFLFYSIGIILWYYEFYVYCTNYYEYNCNDSSAPPDCDSEKVNDRKIAIKWWFGSNVANFLS
jgi:hypothetical protein